MDKRLYLKKRGDLVGLGSNLWMKYDLISILKSKCIPDSGESKEVGKYDLLKDTVSDGDCE